MAADGGGAGGTRGRVCRHCRRCAVNRPRGLCWTCYYTPGVKEQYPFTSRFAPKSTADDYHEPTTEELDAMIAEQMKNLPPWWKHEKPED